MMGALAQYAIVVFGIGAAWLSQSPNVKARAAAPWLGLAAQPAWLYATFTAEQWGMFASSIAYTFVWVRGVRTYWGRK